MAGSFPEAFITLGDNNRYLDGCIVKKPSIVFRVTGIEKNFYVVDQVGYDRAVADYQGLLKEYREGETTYDDLRRQYDSAVSAYYLMGRSSASQGDLNRLYDEIQDLVAKINTLVDRLNVVVQEMDDAPQGIAQFIVPFDAG